MFKIKEYRENPNKLSDHLVWARLVAQGVVEQKTGVLQRTVEFRGPDLASSTQSELISVTAQVNNALRRLGSGWSLFVEARRTKASDYPDSVWPDPVTALIDEERRGIFEGQGRHFESRYFFTFVYAPPKKSTSRFLDFLFEGGESEEGSCEESLRYFQDCVGAIVSLIQPVFPFVEYLDDSATLTYLHSCVSTNQHPVRAPEVPIYLDAMLVDQDVEIGTELRLGEKYVRTLTVRSFPGSTVPGILDALNGLKFEYRWMTRYMAFSKAEALKELKKYQKAWYRQRQGIGSLVTEMFMGEGSDLANSAAVAKAVDADMAINEVENDYVSFGLFTATVTVWGDSREEADERLKEAESTIQSRGFVTIKETFGAFQAWLSSHPGNVYANVRRPLVNSLNLAHMIPMSASWAGPKKNEHLDAPALLTAKTPGGSPFRLSTNVGDVGHTLILGPTGAGKSTLLSLMMLQFFRYEGARVICFDKGRSSRAACLGSGGVFYDLDLSGNNLSFQPLGRVNEEAERTWAVDWLSDILESSGVEATPSRREQLWTALGPGGLGGMPRRQRTMFALTMIVQDVAVRQVLSEYKDGGPYGGLFDGRSEDLVDARFIAFEMEELMSSGGPVPQVLSYLFHRLEESFDGRPTLLVLDEAWMFLDDPRFAAKIREWLKVLRKKRVYVVFATQSVADAVNSPIAPVLLESCLTRIFLPNPRGLEPEVAVHYKKLGLNKEQVGILARATPKREYYYQSQLGNRVFDLGLGPVALAFCGASDPDDQRLMDEIMAMHPGSFAPRWLQLKGIGWAAAALAQRSVGPNALNTMDLAPTLVEADPLDRIFQTKRRA